MGGGSFITLAKIVRGRMKGLSPLYGAVRVDTLRTIEWRNGLDGNVAARQIINSGLRLSACRILSEAYLRIAKYFVSVTRHEAYEISSDSYPEGSTPLTFISQ